MNCGVRCVAMLSPSPVVSGMARSPENHTPDPSEVILFSADVIFAHESRVRVVAARA